MNELYLTDEEIHGKEPTWEEREIERLKEENSNLEEKLETVEDKINTIKIKLNLDIQVNKRCLEEKDITKDAKFLFDQSLRFDNELLEILSDEK